MKSKKHELQAQSIAAEHRTLERQKSIQARKTALKESLEHVTLLRRQKERLQQLAVDQEQRFEASNTSGRSATVNSTEPDDKARRQQLVEDARRLADQADQAVKEAEERTAKEDSLMQRFKFFP